MDFTTTHFEIASVVFNIYTTQKFPRPSFAFTFPNIVRGVVINIGVCSEPAPMERYLRKQVTEHYLRQDGWHVERQELKQCTPPEIREMILDYHLKQALAPRFMFPDQVPDPHGQHRFHGQTLSSARSTSTPGLKPSTP